MKVKEKNPELLQFLGGGFHEDWSCDFDTPEAVIRNYIKQSHHTWIEEAIKELQAFLRNEHSAEELKNILYYDFGCEYRFDEGENNNPREFLQKALKQLQEELHLAKRD